MIRASDPASPMIIESETTPRELEAAFAERQKYLRNLRWFSACAIEIGRDHAGKFVCVAGEELFVGSNPEEVLAHARARHPSERNAIFYKYIPTHRGPKVYADQR
jgi:hypothetical protein